MSDHQIDTINQLREVLKDLQRKLDSRSHMLAQILPYVEFKTGESNRDTQLEFDFVCFEFMEKFSKDIERFRDEYEKETNTKEIKF